MTNQTTKTGKTKVKQTKRALRVWIEGNKLLFAGFKPGKATDEDPKRNEYLVAWDEVPEEIKQIDRDMIKGIPQILAKAGYAVVQLKRQNQP